MEKIQRIQSDLKEYIIIYYFQVPVFLSGLKITRSTVFFLYWILIKDYLVSNLVIQNLLVPPQPSYDYKGPPSEILKALETAPNMYLG